jgi:hypothetical protein
MLLTRYVANVVTYSEDVMLVPYLDIHVTTFIVANYIMDIFKQKTNET